LVRVGLEEVRMVDVVEDMAAVVDPLIVFIPTAVHESFSAAAVASHSSASTTSPHETAACGVHTQNSHINGSAIAVFKG
jgi:hypothetical protein